ncbi:MAG: MarR family transcriptional regulator [Rhizobiales bacterium]|nr:MarR family transcriptional regulator [Hyphomicrobiales bacterium]
MDHAPKTAAPPPAEKTADIDRIGQSMSRMRLMIGRRLVGRLAIQQVAPELDISHLDVLDVVRRASLTETETTVGTVAEMMRVDPSRASRVVAELVERGVLRRDVSQADARRSIVMLTPRGAELLAQVRTVKLSAIADIVADWPDEDAECFARLFERFMDGFEAVYQQREKSLAQK